MLLRISQHKRRRLSFAATTMPTEKPSRLRTERDPAPTDLAEKMIALKRRTAECVFIIIRKSPSRITVSAAQVLEQERDLRLLLLGHHLRSQESSQGDNQVLLK